MESNLLKAKKYNKAPHLCTKSGCGGTVFITHEDGWQCFNCMKIIYKTTAMKKHGKIYKRYKRD